MENKEIIDVLEKLCSENGKEQLIEAVEEWKKKEENRGWVPNNGENYYFIDSEGVVLKHTWKQLEGRHDYFDGSRLAIGNAFKTEEEAKIEVERLKILKIMKDYSRPFEFEEENWQIAYEHDRGEIGTVYGRTNEYGGYHFDSEEIAQKVIDIIGEDKLKKYYFRCFN